MILADKITEERKRCGWSQEELAEKLDVSRQSVSKWESAQSVPDLNRILKMSELFGVSTDYLLKDELASPARETMTESAEVSEDRVKVGIEEASEFLRLTEKHAPNTAKGVSLCVASPIILLLLCGLAESGRFGVTENAAAGIGVSVLLCMVALGVYLILKSTRYAEKYAYLETKAIETEYGVSGMVKEKRLAYTDTHNRMIMTGVILCIVSCVPLVFSAIFTEEAYIIMSMVGLLLAAVSVAVYLFVKTGIIKSGFDKLLEEGDYTPNKKKTSPVLGRISGIYWVLVTAVYLAWSFATDNWDFTWIIWPVAGVLFPVVLTIVKMIIKAED